MVTNKLEYKLFINDNEVKEITFGTTNSPLTLDLRVFEIKDNDETVYLTDNKGNVIAEFSIVDGMGIQVFKKH